MSKFPYTNVPVTKQRTINIPSFIGNDYFRETGVLPYILHLFIKIPLLERI